MYWTVLRVALKTQLLEPPDWLSRVYQYPNKLQLQRMQIVTKRGVCFEAAVIGAGPAGLASVACLLDRQRTGVLWIDPEFKAGRLGKYSLVPSNTRVNLFVRYARHSPCLAALFDGLPCAGKLESELDGNQGCELKWAASLVEQLTAALNSKYGNGDTLVLHRGHVTEVNESVDALGWTLKTADGSSFEARNVYFATGCHPRPPSAHLALAAQNTIDLDTALNPELLASLLARTDRVAVFGSSHSAMLVLYNLLCLVPQAQRPKAIYNFYRSPLKFAQYLRDNGNDQILHDNTGLKGKVAEWVRTWALPADEQETDGGRVVEFEGTDTNLVRIRTAKEGRDLRGYGIDKAIFAIGYDLNPLPAIQTGQTVIRNAKDLTYSNDGSLHFRSENNAHRLQGLFGVGIAFPERVIDLDGTPEMAVGMWKFMRHVARIIQ
jgi:hypothetical protein